MKKELKQLLNEFIERNFSLSEMRTVISNLADLEEAVKLLHSPKRIYMRKEDRDWYELCNDDCKTDLTTFGLEYELKDLVEDYETEE